MGIIIKKTKSLRQSSYNVVYVTQWHAIKTNMLAYIVFVTLHGWYHTNLYDYSDRVIQTIPPIKIHII